MRNLAMVLTAMLASPVYSGTIYYGSERENIKLSYGVATVLRFDEEVKTISQASDFEIAPANPKQPDYRLLSIKPRKRNAKAYVTFILANDALVNTNLRAVKSTPHGKANAFYDLKAKHTQIESMDKSEIGSDVSEVSLMKAMIRADEVIGYKIRSLSKTVRTGVEGISAKLIRVYSGPRYHGYVFKLKNTTDSKTYAIDVKSLTLGRPNVAVLTQVDEKILKPDPGKNQTILRIVSKPTSVYYSVSLPIAPITQDQ